jgi:hypothetical protein
MTYRRGVNTLAAALLVVTVAGFIAGPASANLSGCSNCITAGDIAAGAVRASELNDDLDNSITANDLAAGSVRKSELATGSVGSLEIIDGSVRASDLGVDVYTQEEFDAYSGDHLEASARVDQNGNLLASQGRHPFTAADVSYDATGGRYVFLLEGDVDHMAASVTPQCSTATSWYVETENAATGPGKIYVYLRSATGPVQCSFNLVVVN